MESEFPKEKQSGKPRLRSHSQMADASSRKYHKMKLEAMKQADLLRLYEEHKNWTRGRIDKHWKHYKNYEAEGRLDMALEEKSLYDQQLLHIKVIEIVILRISNKIQWFKQKYMITLGKKQNYEMMKAAEPPEDEVD